MLVGSHARGEARPDSDIDLFAVGDGPEQHVELVDGRTVSIHWFTPDEVRQRLTSPEAALISVCGWREGIVVEDPVGVAAELQREAREWSWERIEAEADAHAVDELVGWAEYAHKLAGAIAAGRTLDASALTADGALRLGRVVAIRARVNAESENAFWSGVAEAAPKDWSEALGRALRANGEDLETASRAALRLFALLADDLDPLLDDRERTIVQHALAVGEQL